MEPNSSFVIHISDQKEGTRKPGISARLGWIGGVPYITNLGGVGKILVNSTPIETNKPYIINVGDTITIANTHLTWHTGTKTDKSIQEPVVTEARAVTSPGPPASQPAPVYNLFVKTPEWTKEFHLRENLISIGRAPDNDIHIDHDQVSHHHAQLIEHADGYEIVDLGSGNGLTFQNKRVSRKLLADGDVVWASRSVSLKFIVILPTVEADVVFLRIATLPKVQAADHTIVLPNRPASPVISQTPEDTVVLPREAHEPPVSRTPAESVAPSEKGEEPIEVHAADQTIYIPKQVGEQTRAETPEVTVVVPKKAAKPPTPETQDDETIVHVEAALNPDVVVGQETALIDMPQVLEEDADLEFVSTTIIRDTKIPHLVIYLPDQVWEVQLTNERMTIGKGEENDVNIPDEFVSRHHASIERRGDDYVIYETQSRNGIWLDKRRVEEHTLRDGDKLSLGRAKMVFKGGFTSNDLTLIGTPSIDGKPARRPVVFVPGLMGSELWLGSERLWPNPKHLISNPEIFRLPGDPRIEARNIVSDVIIVPNIIKLRQYSALGDYLEKGLGYTRGKDLLEFAYDFRQDIRLAAQHLAESIERWQVIAPITIIAHSLGTLVTRYYVERLGGKRFVERIILMGGPHYGAPKSIASILIGPGILPLGMGDDRMRDIIATFPSAYQILPIYPCIIDQDGTYIDALKDDSWLPERQRPFLSAARSFRHELGYLSSVPSVSIFGYGLKTMLRVKVHRRSDGQWQKVDFVEEIAGDGGVPSGSAVLKESEIHPVFQEHGSLFVDDDVKMRLKVELTRSTTWQRRK